MATKKRGAKAARKGTDVLRNAWDSAVEALTRAEQEIETQVRQVLKRRGISTKDAAAVLKQLRARFAKERKKAVGELQGRFQTFQSRLGKEGKALGRVIENAVQGALSALNIPSRREVAELTRKVDALSRKIDTLKK